MRNIIGYYFLTFILVATPVLAESPNLVGGQFDSVSLPQGSGNSQDTNGLVNSAGGQSSVSGMLVDPSLVNDNSAQNAVEGRRDKTEDAIGQGGAGIAAAVAAGAALTAAGVPLLPPPTTPRGVALLTMAGLEFAQAAATGAVTSSNTSGRDILRDGTPEGSQSTALQDAAAQIDTPEFRQALTDNGVNSDAFIQDLVSGKLTDFGSVANALGVTETFTPEQVAQAQAEAVGAFQGGIVGEPEGKGTVDVARITADDSASPRGDSSESLSGGGGVLATGPNASAPAAEAEGDSSASRHADSQLVAKAKSLAAKEIDRLNKLGLGDTVDPQKLIAKYLSKLKAKNKKQARALAKLQPWELKKIGIQTLRERQNIFHISHKTYLTYENWRNKEAEKLRLSRLKKIRAEGKVLVENNR